MHAINPEAKKVSDGQIHRADVDATATRWSAGYPAEHASVCDLSTLTLEGRDALLAATEVGELWGVGRRRATGA